jgi:hypothetical protein
MRTDPKPYKGIAVLHTKSSSFEIDPGGVDVVVDMDFLELQRCMAGVFHPKLVGFPCLLP